LQAELEQVDNFEDKTCPCYQEFVFERLIQREDKLLKRLGEDRPGFMENSLRLINENTIDEIIEYSVHIPKYRKIEKSRTKSGG
jgi:hypothetical protein